MVQHLLDGRFQYASLSHVRMNFSREIGEMRRFQLRKLGHLVNLIVQVLKLRISQRADVLYFPPSGPTALPVARDVALLLATRWMFSRTMLHFYASGISEFYARMPGWLRWVLRRAYFKADAAVYMSSRPPHDATAFGAKKEFIVPSAVVDLFPEGRSRRARAEPPIILYMGVLRESKGVLVLLDAAARLAATGISFRVHLLGEPDSESFRSELSDHLERCALRDRVELLGVVHGREKREVFLNASIFCFPSFFDSEGMPLAVVDAMMFGLPVVASRWRDIPDLVVDGETGFLVEPRNVDQLVDRLRQLLDDAALATRMGQQGRLRYETEYTIGRFWLRMDEVFRQLSRVPT